MEVLQKDYFKHFGNAKKQQHSSNQRFADFQHHPAPITSQQYNVGKTSTQT